MAADRHPHDEDHDTSPAEWLAIHRLLVRYGTALDSKDWDLLRSCFTEGAVAEYGGDDVPGREAIVAFCSSALAPFQATQHLLGTIDIEVRGDNATARTYLHATHVTQAVDGGSLMIVGGTYHDSIVRAGGEWRIQTRRLAVAWREVRPLPPAG